MFDRIAPIYDAMNSVMTAGLDARWRAAAVRASGVRRGDAAIDVACGTGGVTRLLARAVAPDGRVVGVDASPEMLRVARRRAAGDRVAPIRYTAGDALSLPAAAEEFDAATIAFGLRNMEDYAACIGEMRRVTRPGGRVVVLELATPRRGLGRAVAATWFERVVPMVGRLAGGGGAYGYLPASVRGYPAPERIAEIMRESDLHHVSWRRLWPGLVTLHVGRAR